eukprot:7390073-Prymnesium_polylepis.1
MRFGRHGISRNRWDVLRRLAGLYFPVSEVAQLIFPDWKEGPRFDPNDRQRYCRWPIDVFNDHYKEVLNASALIGPDELMSPYLGAVAPKGGPDLVKPNHLPDQSYVPRKPKNTGEEIQCVADHDAEVIFKLELSEGEAAHPQQEYFQEWGYTTAMNLRLSAGYHDSGTIYMGDSHFTSVDTVEGMLLKVSCPARVSLRAVRSESEAFPSLRVRARRQRYTAAGQSRRIPSATP